MTDKERAFLDEIQAVCEKHSVSIVYHADEWFHFESGDIDIAITDDLLEE